jgi:hypothetical protein
MGSLIRVFRTPGKTGGGAGHAFGAPSYLWTMQAQMVASIEPSGCDPGLVAFVCAQCDAADSPLVYPANLIREASRPHAQHAEQR